jgi:hypothetical protein
MAAQAQVLAEAMGNARINIVGGDGQFFQRFVSAISLGQSVDGALEQSDTLRAIVSDLVARPDGSGNGNGGGQALTAVLGELAALSSKAGKQS